MVWEPGLHLEEVLEGAQLHGGEGDAISLPNSDHHRMLVVHHQESLSEVGLLRLMVGGHQLLLQCWQQDDKKVRGGE